ncbi:MAG: flagellar M-ring protein FliF C-terminal domain-containing protein [Fidelibacterota bacterium]
MRQRLRGILGGGAVVAFLAVLAVGQESTYLAQKLMLENDLRKRIAGALEKILEDHRYVLDVTVALKFTPTVREEVTFTPEEAPSKAKPAPAEVEVPEEAKEEEGRRRSRVTGLPIPGFDFGVEEEAIPEEEVPAEGEEQAVSVPPEPAVKGAKVISQSYTDITTSMPVIEKMEISCILPEGSSPELIENVRQIIMVASHFDRSRGDVLSVMTASFRDRRDERTAEAIILRSIAEKIDQLEERQAETDLQVAEDWRKELDQWKQEEARRREEERSVWRAELEKLENERLRREFEREKRAILERDSLELAALTGEINDLKAMLATAELTPQQQQKAQGEMAIKERQRAQLDSVIEEKLALLEETRQEMRGLERGGVSNLPIYLMSAISLLAVAALAAVIIFNGRTRPRYVVPPPWLMRPPGKKKVTREKKEDEGEAPPPKAVPPPPPPPPPKGPEPEEDPSVLQSEIKSTRQSIVSMSVGQPETASEIVKEWLEEEAPAPAEEAPPPAAAAPAPPAAEEEKGEGKKKKKKK